MNPEQPNNNIEKEIPNIESSGEVDFSELDEATKQKLIEDLKSHDEDSEEDDFVSPEDILSKLE